MESIKGGREERIKMKGKYIGKENNVVGGIRSSYSWLRRTFSSLLALEDS